MKIISHRGNLDGPDSSIENSPKQIEKCLDLGFECEIDLRINNGKPYLGHDSAQYSITLDWLLARLNLIWIHCKDSESLSFLKKAGEKFNYFWHENDKHTITSQGIFWNYPGGPITSDSIAVLPENWWEKSQHHPLSQALGVCTDFPVKFREELKLV